MKTLALLAFVAGLAPSPGAFDIPSLLDIRHPSGAVWSPDGSRIAFLWDRAGTQNLYLVEPATGAPEVLTAYSSGLMGEPFWSVDGSTLYFEREGDLWSVPARKGKTPKSIFGTVGPETEIRPSPDGTKVLFTSEESGRQNLYIVDTSDLR